MKKNRRALQDFLLYSVFFIYLFILILVLFRGTRENRMIKLIPFSTISNFLSKDRIRHVFTVTNLLGNIVLFIPLGMYFMLFSKDKKTKKSVLWICLISTTVELIQYAFKLGVGDIDDVILNTLGGYLGIVIYQILLSRLKEENKVKQFITYFAPIGIVMSFIVLYFLRGRF